MRTFTSNDIKKEIQHCSKDDLIKLCLRLVRFKKENKELLGYLLFLAHDEEAYVESIKEDISESFKNVNKKSYYYMRKSVRKILTDTKKFIRYSGRKETEVEVLLFFCKELKLLKPSMKNHLRLYNIFKTQTSYIDRKIKLLHEDLHLDYQLELDELIS